MTHTCTYIHMHIHAACTHTHAHVHALAAHHSHASRTRAHAATHLGALCAHAHAHAHSTLTPHARIVDGWVSAGGTVVVELTGVCLGMRVVDVGYGAAHRRGSLATSSIKPGLSVGLNGTLPFIVLGASSDQDHLVLSPADQYIAVALVPTLQCLRARHTSWNGGPRAAGGEGSLMPGARSSKDATRCHDGGSCCLSLLSQAWRGCGRSALRMGIMVGD
jgi:hypothetical protein